MRIKDLYRSKIKYITFLSEKTILNKYIKPSENSISLDLGCGTIPENLFNANKALGIDIVPSVNEDIFQCDLSREKIPFQDSYFDFITARDLIEHIPRQIYINQTLHLPFIHLMNEIHRVLQPSGIIYMNTPFYPNLEAFIDPTHVNFITTETFKKYFSEPFNYAKRYGFTGKFSLERQYYKGDNLVTILKKL